MYEIRASVYEIEATVYEIRVSVYEIEATVYEIRVSVYEIVPCLYYAGFGMLPICSFGLNILLNSRQTVIQLLKRFNYKILVLNMVFIKGRVEQGRYLIG